MTTQELHREVATTALRLIEDQRRDINYVLGECAGIEARPITVLRRILAERLRELPAEERHLRRLCVAMEIEL